ncbi:unnamed protein product [Paramecium sonneborni]|uniref:Uncharacterized protein n=1 Tax=Paramecium sonneborni TaxID=65129 RepID=A0A8S1RNL4_9CILI|nr:unnamed protein product [Paramecium sonneborni]
MGVCSSRTQKNQQQYSLINQTQTQPTEQPKQTTQLIVQPQQKTQQPILVNQYEQQENERMDVFPLSKEEFDLFKDDVCIKNIHKQFENINQIFDRLTQELDKLSQQFLSGTDYEALK